MDRVVVSRTLKAAGDGREELAVAMLWLTGYTFLLRLLSEVSRGAGASALCLRILCAGTSIVQGRPEQRRAGRETNMNMERR